MTHPLDPRYNLYNPCANPLCDALVTPSVAYCCYPCSVASEGRYEVHEEGLLGHTEECKARQLERRSTPMAAEPPLDYITPWRPPLPPGEGPQFTFRRET